MPEPKAQLVDPQGPIDVPGLSITGVTTATGGFVGAVQGTATGFNTTAVNLNVGIVTATKFSGNTTGNVSGLADDTNINVGIITSTSFTGDLFGNAAGLSTTTANINAGIMSATSFAGNFTGVASGITGTPNIVVGIMTGTLKGDGSSLTGIAATNWIANNVTANSSTTAIDLALGNVVKFTQSANTTVSFANTGTSNIVSFIRVDDNSGTDRTITWPSAIKWNGGTAPTLVNNTRSSDVNVITLLTRDEGVTWYGWESINSDPQDMALYAWGYNEYGNLGLNNVVKYSSPVQLPGTTWGAIGNLSGQGDEQSLFSKTDGTLWSWGQNDEGELGQNNKIKYSSPTQIPGTTWGTTARTMTTGRYLSGAIKTDGTLWIWGRNNSGSLGQNNRTQYSSPIQVPGTTWSSCYGGMRYGFGAIKTDGTLWMWGNGGIGQLGQNNETQRSSPVQVPGTTWSTLSGGEYRFLATKTDGTAWAWGHNAVGELGLNNRTQYSSPVQVPGTWSTFKATSGGSLAVKTDGTLWAWGGNWYGNLGQNGVVPTNSHRSSPVQIPGTTWADADGASGNHYAVGRKTDGTLWAWGNNYYGWLGQNNTTRYSSPVQIGSDTSWTSIGAANGVFALKKA